MQQNPPQTQAGKALAAQPVALAGWVLHPAYPEDDAQVRALFEQVFGHPMPQAQWQWKYANTRLRGTLLRKSSGEVVAFFGGMSRPVVHRGQAYLCVQNGDVMVHPQERGVFSRRGAVYQITAHFFGHHVGPGAEYAFAYGFPNARAFAVGAKLGLYEKAGQMMELRWSGARPARHWTWYWRTMAADGLAAVDALWPQMQQSWPQMFVPVRDGARWAYRYLQRPEARYVLLLVRQRCTHRPLAALALREHEGHCEWLDYAGPARHIAQAVQTAREFAFTAGKPLVALISDAIAQEFAAGADSIQPSQISLPVNASAVAAPEKPWLGHLWLMGGDSDFM